jgi:hypothetical protein
MRILIESKFELHGLEKSDIDFLKACTIFHATIGECTTIDEQKIDLDPEAIEDFLTIVDMCGQGLISLERYCHGRYALKLGE